MNENYKDTRLAFSVHVHCSKCYKAFNNEVPSHNCEGISLCPFDDCEFKIINVLDDKMDHK